MSREILNAIQRWARRGMYWPFVHDPQRNEPSVTLMFFYVSFLVAVAAILTSSALMLLKGDYLTATVMPTMLLVLGFIFYRLRNLDRVKIDLDDKQIELSDEPTKDEMNDEQS